MKINLNWMKNMNCKTSEERTSCTIVQRAHMYVCECVDDIRFERYVYMRWRDCTRERKRERQGTREQDKEKKVRIKTHGTHLFIVCPVLSLWYMCIMCSSRNRGIARAFSLAFFSYSLLLHLLTNIIIIIDIIILLCVVVLVAKASERIHTPIDGERANEKKWA